MSLVLNAIFNGEVAAVHNYGAFVRMPGSHRTQGLVHKSQISSSRVDDATEVLALNDKVWCKIISVSDDNKIALSMKVVDQGSGRDLDPNGVQTSLDAQQRKERGGYRESNAITLDAVFNTKCSKCGVPGHLSKNCFKTADGKSYDLIPEPEIEKKIFGSAEDRLKRLAGYDFGGTDAKESRKGKVPKEKKVKKRRASSDESNSNNLTKKLKQSSKVSSARSKRNRDSSSSNDSRMVSSRKCGSFKSTRRPTETIKQEKEHESESESSNESFKAKKHRSIDRRETKSSHHSSQSSTSSRSNSGANSMRTLKRNSTDSSEDSRTEKRHRNKELSESDTSSDSLMKKVKTPSKTKKHKKHRKTKHKH